MVAYMVEKDGDGDYCVVEYGFSVPNDLSIGVTIYRGTESDCENFVRSIDDVETSQVRRDFHIVR